MDQGQRPALNMDLPREVALGAVTQKQKRVVNY